MLPGGQLCPRRAVIRLGDIALTLLRSLAALAVLFCVLGSSFAAVIHVDDSGSDTLGDGSSAAPYATIQHAVNMALGPDDTINVSAGTYDECVDAVSPLSLSIIAEDPDPTRTKIRGDGICTTVRPDRLAKRSSRFVSSHDVAAARSVRQR